MKKKILLFIAFFGVTAVILYTLTAVLVLGLGKVKVSFSSIFGRREIWVFWFAELAGVLIFLMVNKKVLSNRSVLKKNYLEDSHWLTFREMKKNDNLKVTSLKKLGSEADGIPIYAEKKGRDIKIVMAKPIHTLAVGTTGSGKTSGFVDPFIQIISRCKTKPGMVITDPKGELYQRHAKALKDMGYAVHLIDLDDMYHSAKWNPFNEVFVKTDIINNAKIEQSPIAQKRGKYYYLNAEYLTLDEAEKVRAENPDAKFYYLGKEYPDLETAEKEKKIHEQELTDEIFQEIQDIIYTVCPIENKHDSTWQKGARDLVFALALAFWEDVRDGLMTRKKFNLYNLYKNISVYCDNECAEFKAFFENRSTFSKTKGLANTVLVSQDKTLTSYLGDVNQYFNWMADNGIASLTSGNDFDLNRFDETPNVLFLRVPDHKETRHKLVKLFVTQMYKALVDKASRNEREERTKEAELFRNVYFIMDEFVNMPKFDSIETMLRVGRSRKIFLIPIIQDYAGLDAKYTKDVATTIRSNCNIKIFIGTTDLATQKEFSELCGKKKVSNISFSEQKDLSVSSQAQERPLIYPSELQVLNDPPHRMGNAIVLAFGKYPLRSKYTPLFKAREMYQIESSRLAKAEAELFVEENYFYDIAKRNAYVEEEKEVVRTQNEKLQEEISNLMSQTAEENPADNKAAKLLKLLNEKLNSLKGKISDDTLKALFNSDIIARIDILDSLIDRAYECGDRFLIFELAGIKVFIENSLTAIDFENAAPVNY